MKTATVVLIGLLVVVPMVGAMGSSAPPQDDPVTSCQPKDEAAKYWLLPPWWLDNGIITDDGAPF